MMRGCYSLALGAVVDEELLSETAGLASLVSLLAALRVPEGDL